MSKSDTKKPWVDPDDAPELTGEWFAKAEIREGERVIRKAGRPAGHSKVQVTLRVDTDVLERYRATGTGWQTRMNQALREKAPGPTA